MNEQIDKKNFNTAQTHTHKHINKTKIHTSHHCQTPDFKNRLNTVSISFSIQLISLSLFLLNW